MCALGSPSPGDVATDPVPSSTSPRRFAARDAALNAESPVDPAGRGLFDGGPPLKLQKRLGLIRPGEPHILRRVALAVLVGWLPLVLLAAVESLILQHPGALGSFASDFGVHTRCLVTVPCFLLAEVVLIPRLGAIARHFLDAGLVREEDRARFDAAAASTARLRDSIVVEGLVIVLAYGLTAMLLAGVHEIPDWQGAGEEGARSYSAAGWWHQLVSLPLLVVLFLGWIWRLLLWTRFLWLMSRLDLRLVPAHPDRAAGLMFIGNSVRSSVFLGSALGAVVAGAVANGVLHRGVSPLAYRYSVVGLVAFVVALSIGPLLVFTGKLLREWRRGVFAYGALADRLGRQFERKWFEHGGRVDQDLLELPDFSAATDLYQVVSNVYEMRLLPLDLKTIVPLVIATLLPFVPALLVAVPLDRLVAEVANLLF